MMYELHRIHTYVENDRVSGEIHGILYFLAGLYVLEALTHISYKERYSCIN